MQNDLPVHTGGSARWGEVEILTSSKTKELAIVWRELCKFVGAGSYDCK